MSNRISYESQIEQGLVRKPVADSFVESSRQLPVRRMTADDYGALQVATTPPQPHQAIQVPQLPPSQHTAHLRHVDDPVTNARAALLYSAAIAGTSALIVAGLLLLAVVSFNASINLSDAIGIEITVTGALTLVALIINRGVGLHHSATGITHHEQTSQVKMHDRSASVQEYQIDSQERIALHAIDRHADLIEKRWQIERGIQHES